MFAAQIIGNLGNDPEMRYSQGGSPFLRFNVAANIRVREANGEWADKTEWVRVTVFGARADTLSQYLRKGSRVFVQGRMECRPWTNRQGEVRAGVEVIGETVEFMSNRDSADGDSYDREPVAAGTRRAPQGRQEPIDESDLEDLPF